MKNHFPALCRTLTSGASGGIGPEAVKLCLSLGPNVTAHYNSNSEPIQTLKVSFPALQCAQTDLFSESAMKSMYMHFGNTVFPCGSTRGQPWHVVAPRELPRELELRGRVMCIAPGWVAILMI
ncbi:hypothetical protein P692DRAFT_20278288 [Suillus brevipes Sb2]|nr:hypothetical protein P692DRAFT_20278288 [Suillus brevipes Sb2]